MSLLAYAWVLPVLPLLAFALVISTGRKLPRMVARRSNTNWQSRKRSSESSLRKVTRLATRDGILESFRLTRPSLASSRTTGASNWHCSKMSGAGNRTAVRSSAPRIITPRRCKPRGLTARIDRSSARIRPPITARMISAFNESSGCPGATAASASGLLVSPG